MGAAEAGQSYTTIAARLGVTKGQVSHLMAKLFETGIAKDRSTSGQPKVKPAQNIRRIAKE